MKKITELYEEILQDEGLKAEFVEAAKDNKIEAFLQKNDCTATPSQLQEFVEKKQSEQGLLSDAELDAAAGGASFIEGLFSIGLLGVGCALVAGISASSKGTGVREGYETMLCHDLSGRKKVINREG